MDSSFGIIKNGYSRSKNKSNFCCYLIKQNKNISSTNRKSQPVNQNNKETDFNFNGNLSNFKSKLIKKWFIQNNQDLGLYKVDASLPLSNFLAKGRIFKNNNTLFIIGI